MVQLFDKETGSPLGTVSDEQLQYLADRLEEESAVDDDYYINRSTVDLFENDGAEPELVAVLRRALGGREEMEIRWQRE